MFRLPVAIVLALLTLSGKVTSDAGDAECAHQQRMTLGTVNDGTFGMSDKTPVIDNDMIITDQKYIRIDAWMAGGPLNLVLFKARTQRVKEIRLTCRDENECVLYEKTKTVDILMEWRTIKFTVVFSNCAYVEAKFIKRDGKNDMWIKALTMTTCRVHCEEIIITDPHLRMNVTHTDVNWGSGTDVTFYCDLGYRLIGDAFTTCDNEGEWTSGVPLCERIVCPTPVDVPNSFRDITNYDNPPPFGTETIITYSCDALYAMIIGGAIVEVNYWMVKCDLLADETGAWDLGFPTCERIACDALGSEPSLLSSSITWEGTPWQWATGTVATYECDPGYKVIGSDTRTCTQVGFVGEWTPAALPSCERIACPAYTSTASNRIDTVNQADASTSWATGTTVEFSCEEGYNINEGPSITCAQSGDDGNWVGTEASCERIYCPPLSNPTGGTMDVAWESDGAGVWAYGVCATFSANYGYYRDGAYQLCCADSEWDDVPPEFLPITCSGLSAPDNGYIDASSAFSIPLDECVIFYCDTDYELIGSSVLCCTENTGAIGKWVPSTSPVCKYKKCSQDFNDNVVVNSVTHGSESWGVDTLVILGCESGYKLVGTPVLTCSQAADGTRSWSPQPEPECEEVFCSAMTVTDGQLSPDTEDWHIEQCYTVTCDQPYMFVTPVGSENICCELVSGAGEWSAIPACARPMCTPVLSSIESGSLSVHHATDTDWGTSTIIDFYCIDNYHLEGASTLTCLEDNGSAYWDYDIPTCERDFCNEITDIENGIVILTHGNTNLYVMSCVQFKCEYGYRLNGSVSACCFGDGASPTGASWNSDLPKCDEITCDPPAITSNMTAVVNHFDSPPDYRVDTTVIITCNPGLYMLINGAEHNNDFVEVTCEQTFDEQGEWSHDNIECIEIPLK